MKKYIEFISQIIFIAIGVAIFYFGGLTSWVYYIVGYTAGVLHIYGGHLLKIMADWINKNYD